MKKILSFVIIFTLFLNFASVNAETTKELKKYSCPSTTSSAVSSKSVDNLVGHYNNKVKIVFSDIDGTLIPLVKRVDIPNSLKCSVQKLKQAQIPLIFVTGRSSWETQQISRQLNNPNTYIISLQGAEIINPEGKIIYQNNISNKNFRKIIKEIELFNKFLADIDSSKNSSNEGIKFFFYANETVYSKENIAFPALFEKVTVIKSIDDLGSNFTSGKIMIYEPNTQKLRLFQVHLKKNFPNYNINLVSDYYCEIAAPSANKGNAVKKLANILGVDLKNSVAFGDSENDNSMLELVKTNGGLAVAVGNAMNSVKNNANFITDSVFEDGFAKAVDKILINNAGLK